MSNNRPTLNDFKSEIEVLFGKALTEPATVAAQDFWDNWSSFDSLIADQSLFVHPDMLRLAMQFPQYRRYNVWRGAGMIGFFLGILVFWFFGLSGLLD